MAQLVSDFIAFAGNLQVKISPWTVFAFITLLGLLKLAFMYFRAKLQK